MLRYNNFLDDLSTTAEIPVDELIAMYQDAQEKMPKLPKMSKTLKMSKMLGPKRAPDFFARMPQRG